jgi:hypothetical protein
LPDPVGNQIPEGEPITDNITNSIIEAQKKQRDREGFLRFNGDLLEGSNVLELAVFAKFSVSLLFRSHQNFYL